MASSIPRRGRKAVTDALAAKSLKVALFVDITNYDPLTATTYAALKAGGATEVSHASYTTGGYALVGMASTNLATNGAILTANPTSVATATFTCRYGVIYDATSGNIEGISDFGQSYTVTNGTITVTWNVTTGIINVQ